MNTLQAVVHVSGTKLDVFMATDMMRYRLDALWWYVDEKGYGRIGLRDKEKWMDVVRLAGEMGVVAMCCPLGDDASHAFITCLGPRKETEPPFPGYEEVLENMTDPSWVKKLEDEARKTMAGRQVLVRLFCDSVCETALQLSESEGEVMRLADTFISHVMGQEDLSGLLEVMEDVAGAEKKELVRQRKNFLEDTYRSLGYLGPMEASEAVTDWERVFHTRKRGMIAR